MSSSFFLTELDPRMRVKGSRDPLGFMSIWTRFGREIVGNLTTVTLSVRSFTTLLLGLDLIDEMIDSGDAKEEQRLDLFIKFEQVAAYSRVALLPDDVEARSQVEGEAIRGIERVTQRLRRRKPVRVSASPADQILASQKVYGIWGLFPVAARASGLLRPDAYRLSDEARRFVAQEYRRDAARAGDWAKRCRQLLLRDDSTFAPLGAHRDLAEALAKRLGPTLTDEERKFYGETLVLGRRLGDERLAARQERFWRLLEKVNGRSARSWAKPFDLTELEQTLQAMGGDDADGLAVALREIRAVEPVLAAAASLFRFLLLCHGRKTNSVQREIREAWGGAGLRHLSVRQLEPLAGRLFTSVDPLGGPRLVKLASQLAEGDYPGAVDTVLAQNAAVMKGRRGAPWIRIERGVVTVHEKESPRPLPSKEELLALWSNPYFLNSLKTVGAKVYGKTQP